MSFAPGFDSVCVFCASSLGQDARFQEAAAATGTALARRGIELVWGGGRAGLMGVVADAALAADGDIFGVIPEFMAERELAHPEATEMVVVESMHARKAVMAERADAFIALPGGFGTFDELFEIITWSQLRLHAKPIGILNVAGYYDHLIAMMDQSVSAGFVQAASRDSIVVAESIDALLDALAAWKTAHQA
ncbi:TIGR00730 family Rossman fold protein [Burkholderiaceae bacterium DAT-1]|nr:TIGR00730 family Rossman fold protein [Burkholderiaceae bacterium DAT-1]